MMDGSGNINAGADPQGVPVFDRLYRETEKANATASEKLIFNAVIRKLLDRMVSDLVENTSKRVRDAAAKTVDDVRSFPNGWPCSATKSKPSGRRRKLPLRKSLLQAAISTQEKDAAERVITELFEHWVAHPEALPASHRDKGEAGAAAAGGVRLHCGNDGQFHPQPA